MGPAIPLQREESIIDDPEQLTSLLDDLHEQVSSARRSWNKSVDEVLKDPDADLFLSTKRWN